MKSFKMLVASPDGFLEVPLAKLVGDAYSVSATVTTSEPQLCIRGQLFELCDVVQTTGDVNLPDALVQLLSQPGVQIIDGRFSLWTFDRDEPAVVITFFDGQEVVVECDEASYLDTIREQLGPGYTYKT